MRVDIQWARRNPQDWETVDHLGWALLPDRGIPTAVHNGNQRGWVQAVCVQGVLFEHWDHYAVGAVLVGTEAGLVVAVWNDDPDDWSEPYGQRWTFLDPAPDPALGGAINTRQTVGVYGPDEWTQAWIPVSNASTHRWAEWPDPPAAVRHGVWVTDGAYTAAQTTRSRRRWEEWVT